jgi:hypothetical protein
MAADDDAFNLAGTMHQQSYLSVQFKGKLTEHPRHFRIDDLVPLDPFCAKAFKNFQLIGF